MKEQGRNFGVKTWVISWAFLSVTWSHLVEVGSAKSEGCEKVTVQNRLPFKDQSLKLCSAGSRGLTKYHIFICFALGLVHSFID